MAHATHQSQSFDPSSGTKRLRRADAYLAVSTISDSTTMSST